MVLLDRSRCAVLAYGSRKFEIYERKSPPQRPIANCHETQTGLIACMKSKICNNTATGVASVSVGFLVQGALDDPG